MKTKRITICAMLIALNIVLCLLAPIEVLNFKLTFEAFPILIAGIMLGPIDGMIVGTMGSLIYQIYKYGIMVTTPLWVFPHLISGFIVGLYSKRYNYKLTTNQTIFITISSSMIVTILNTLAIYVDSKVNGYYTFIYVFGSILIKIITNIVLSAFYSLIIPKLINNIKKIS